MRERREDIPLLARYFLHKCARELGVEAKRLSEATVRYLGAQDFPANVRQLENLCHWLTVMAPSATIEIKDLPPEIRGDAPPSAEGWIPLLEREVEALLHRQRVRFEIRALTPEELHYEVSWPVVQSTDSLSERIMAMDKSPETEVETAELKPKKA